jgi:hypothetical protein
MRTTEGIAHSSAQRVSYVVIRRRPSSKIGQVRLQSLRKTNSSRCVEMMLGDRFAQRAGDSGRAGGP